MHTPHVSTIVLLGLDEEEDEEEEDDEASNVHEGLTVWNYVKHIDRRIVRMCIVLCVAYDGIHIVIPFSVYRSGM